MAKQAENIFRELDAAYEAAERATDGFEMVGHLAKLTRLDREFRAALSAQTADLPEMTDDELLAALAA